MGEMGLKKVRGRLIELAKQRVSSGKAYMQRETTNNKRRRSRVREGQCNAMMQIEKLRKSVKRVVSAGVNGEGELKCLGFDTRRRKVFGARSGAGKKRLTQVAPSRCGVNTGQRPRTSSSTARNLRSARLFGGTVFFNYVGTSRQAYDTLQYPSGTLSMLLLSNGPRSGLRYELRKLTGWL